MSKQAPDDKSRNDSNNTKQTDEPWKGSVEKQRTATDLEKWHETNTH